MSMCSGESEPPDDPDQDEHAPPVRVGRREGMHGTRSVHS